MKLATIEWKARSQVALVQGEELVDLTAELGVGADDVTGFLAMGEDARRLADRCIRSPAPRIALDEVTLRNHKATPVTIEVNEPIGGTWRMLQSSHEWSKTSAWAAQFTVPVGVMSSR